MVDLLAVWLADGIKTQAAPTTIGVCVDIRKKKIAVLEICLWNEDNTEAQMPLNVQPRHWLISLSNKDACTCLYVKPASWYF